MPAVWTLKVERMLNHDKGDFTQGLVIDGGELLEGTGKRGFSRLVRKNLGSGHTIMSVRLAAKYFGEGVTVFGDTIYQLTWESGELLQYDRKTLTLKGLLTYEGEGWGLTHDGKEMIMSDGTDTLQFRDPETFEVTRRQRVTMAGKPLARLNELEFVDGLVFSNVWGTNFIVVIDPANGEVVARIDCTKLVEIAKKHHSDSEVLNGIAVFPGSGHLLITGKWWPRMFEVSVVKSP